MRETRDTGIPEFKSLEEEKEYWEARGPLAEGHEGKVNKPGPKQKRSSFLAVRLTGEELTRLRDVAAKQGLGPSTYARTILKSAIERETQTHTINMEQLSDLINRISPQFSEKAKAFYEKIAIGNPENPAMLVIDENYKEEYMELSLLFIQTFLSLVGIQLITSEGVNFKKSREIASEKNKKEEIKS